jgi:SAM-dependent methyltransferase
MPGAVTAVDLNTVDIAKERNIEHKNMTFIEADLATMDLGRRFDIAISIGVIHHTDNPDKTFANIVRHVKKNGRIIIWVYSREGNFLMERIVEPARKHFLSKLSHGSRLFLSQVLTAMLYPFVYSVYLLPLSFLPYYEYFKNFRRLSFQRNLLNVYDKINAPQVEFISRQRIEGWFSNGNFDNVHISPYKNVSWRASATVK